MKALVSVCMGLGICIAGAALAQELPGALSPQQKAAMMEADVVILGEVHDNAAHHEGQAALMAEIAPRAVVFEMLDGPMADTLNGLPRDDVADWGKRIGWEEAGWPDFGLYQPVFEALGDAVVVGAAADRAVVRAAFDQGAAAAFGKGAERFGLHVPLPDAQREARRALQFDAHCQAMPFDLMDGMVEAQRLRDASFSKAVVGALERYGPPVVVITGNGHARRDWAMPFMLAQAVPTRSIYSIGFVEAPAAAKDDRFDATLVADAAPRDDPCAAFAN
ncbi:DUF399 domain containing protein [Sulfitobacter noctilucicola]|uniref:Putative iron-regulated protein n=1 Tax=Sulfitobacter noctilucicola TaxID=1342301 RepID=A0A7W6M9U8_9RHOB|nr:ChaN family lipoprotein [Sulfitobacter noctilucicola]KIN63454.1 DUF399 domain containing protein [Sulfitobacter noctilucicola]MBB4175034.1 putative iron-regulated protein [Sulfitobacter noctilucicola]